MAKKPKVKYTLKLSGVGIQFDDVQVKLIELTEPLEIAGNLAVESATSCRKSIQPASLRIAGALSRESGFLAVQC